MSRVISQALKPDTVSESKMIDFILLLLRKAICENEDSYFMRRMV